MKLLLLLSSFFYLLPSSHGQAIYELLAASQNLVAGGGGGGYSLITTANGTGDGSSTVTTTASANTIGANLFVVVAGGHFWDSSTYVTNNGSGQAFTMVTNKTGSGRIISLWYLYNPTTNASTTITFKAPGNNNVGNYGIVSFYAYSGASASPLDVWNAVECGNCSVSGVQPGSVTPSSSSGVMVAGAISNVNGTWSVDSSFAIDWQGANTIPEPLVSASYTVTGTSAKNPKFTKDGGLGDCSGVIAVFK